MKDILIGIDKLAEEELEKANKVNPLFHSDHEGYAVFQEEIEEAEEMFEAAKESKNFVWEAIKADYPEGAHEKVKEMRYCLAQTAAEMIQAIAMCDKFITSQELRESEGK